MRETKLFRYGAEGKCVDCGLIDGHSNACIDASPFRMVDKLHEEIERLRSFQGHMNDERGHIKDLLEEWKGLRTQKSDLMKALLEIVESGNTGASAGALVARAQRALSWAQAEDRAKARMEAVGKKPLETIQMNADPKWLEKAAAQEANGYVGVGAPVFCRLCGALEGYCIHTGIA